MYRKFKISNCLLLILTLSCTTTTKNSGSVSEKTREDLEQATHEIPAPRLPDGKVIRQELAGFKLVLNKKRALSKEDWKLHDQLLDYYIQLKKTAGKPNTVLVPARGRWTKRFESYCLDSAKAQPDDNEKISWEKTRNAIPYARELLNLAAKGKALNQEDVQTLLWNLQNKTVWEDYPAPLQRVLLSVDPQAPKKLPSRLSETVRDEVFGLIRDHLPGVSEAEDIVALARGRYHDYNQFRASIEGRKSKYKLKATDSVPPIPGTPLFAVTKSEGFKNQHVTFYNPTDQDVVLDLSQYELKPQRSDVQPLALIERQASYDPSLVSDLERTLYVDMIRLGLGSTPVLNDVIDLFEASTGRGFLNDEWLSDEDRFLSAMGVLAGSGQYYRYAKKIVHGPKSYVRDAHDRYRKAKNEKSLKSMEKVVLMADKKIPKEWGKEPSHPGKSMLQGFEYAHPKKDHIRIRVMPGNPNSEFPNSRKPYVRQTIDGKPIDRHGNIVDKYSEGAHIPLDEYEFTNFWKNHDKK